MQLYAEPEPNLGSWVWASAHMVRALPSELPGCPTQKKFRDLGVEEPYHESLDSNATCEPSFIAKHQCQTSLMLNVS